MTDKITPDSEPLEPNTEEQKLLQALRQNPILGDQIQVMVSRFEQEVADGMDAHEAEERLIDSLQKPGVSMMAQWAQNTQEAALEQARQDDPKLHKHSKKKLQWNTTFGTISIEQIVLRRAPKGARVHPFRDFAKISHRGASRILSRRIVDFSAERSFAQSALALREHYHIEVPISCIDRVTAQVCREAKAHNSKKPETVIDAEVLVSETDGSMLPVISTEPPEGATETDRRKHRKCHWKEIRVSTVSNPTLAGSYYGVALGEPYMVGCMMFECCQFSGMTPQTRVHAVSDGAPWIAEQYEQHFGTQCGFLLDFFHACDYLVAAAQSTLMALKERNQWLEKCKNLLCESRGNKVIESLGELELKAGEEAKEAVKSAINYLRKREEKGQLDYRKALEEGLPIGSGEVESAHRHILQKRLKIAGAWWRLERAEEMAQLRAMRANQRWNGFWEQKVA